MNDNTSAHISTGIRKVLESPVAYEFFQGILGVKRLRKYFIKNYVRPFSGAKILDVGCGAGAILDFLPPDVQYVGFDLNPHYISFARKKYRGRGSFNRKRVSNLAPHAWAGSFDIVLAMAIFHHLDDREMLHLVQTAHEHLRPGGILASFDPCYHPDQSKVARFILSKDRGRSIRTREGYQRWINKYFPVVEGDLATDLLFIPYSHFLMRATKT